jgi:hypothetical protein
MPWRQMPMKDVGGCEKPRGAADQARLPVDLRMGEPGWGHAQSSRPEHIGPVKETGGIETSQYPEEGKATATPRVAASETGRA